MQYVRYSDESCIWVSGIRMVTVVIKRHTNIFLTDDDDSQADGPRI